jgi:hypothetical protein
VGQCAIRQAQSIGSHRAYTKTITVEDKRKNERGKREKDEKSNTKPRQYNEE